MIATLFGKLHLSKNRPGSNLAIFIRAHSSLAVILLAQSPPHLCLLPGLDARKAKCPALERGSLHAKRQTGLLIVIEVHLPESTALIRKVSFQAFLKCW